MKAAELNRKPFKGSINVTQLLKAPVGYSHSYCIDEIVHGQNKNSARGNITLTQGGQGILAQGELTVEVELTCSRCLNTYLYPIIFHIQEEFFPIADLSSNSSLSDETGNLAIYNHNMIDLGELIRQHALLSLPMKPLCRPDCTGIKEVSLYGSAQKKNCQSTPG